MNTNKKAVRLIADICFRKGIRKVVFSPGSRSAPLVIAFSQIKGMECIVIPDERVAGYFALGMAQQLGEPVAVVCTSGTAVLNLSPAVCEAFYQKVPLLVLTADRPEGAEKRGDNQAIRQDNVFGHFATSIPIDGDADSPAKLNAIAKDMVYMMEQISAPFCDVAHINIRLSEPLYNTTTTKSTGVTIPGNLLEKYPPMRESQVKRVKDTFQKLEKKMLIVGSKRTDPAFETALAKLNSRSDLVIVHENLAQLRLKDTVRNADAVLSGLSKDDSADLVPDLVITLGNQIVSKKLKQFLYGKPKTHWDIPVRDDINFGRKMFGDALELVEPVTEREFLDILINTPQTNVTDYKLDWLIAAKNAKTKSNRFLAKLPFSDMKVFQTLIQSFPENANIQYGNSTPVRYSNIFEHKTSLTVNANRGASGIDGCVSTAAGAAYANKKMTVAIVGDISFFYDSNALWHNYLSPYLRIIIINNGGGNIFRLIDGPTKTGDFEKFFETKHNLTAKHLASMYGLPYYICASQKELEKCLKTFYKPSKSAKILEIKTNGKLSADVYRKYFEYLSKIEK